MTDPTRNLTDADIEALAKALAAQNAVPPAPSPPPEEGAAVVSEPESPPSPAAPTAPEETPTPPPVSDGAAETPAPPPAVDPLQDFADRFRLAVTPDLASNLGGWLKDHFGVTL